MKRTFRQRVTETLRRFALRFLWGLEDFISPNPTKLTPLSPEARTCLQSADRPRVVIREELLLPSRIIGPDEDVNVLGVTGRYGRNDD
jgi:hypothetical protein